MPAPKNEKEWKAVFDTIEAAITRVVLPSVSFIAEEGPDPFKILVSTMISLRTKDDVTLAASHRLFAAADTPEKMAALEEETIAQTIYPAGFYKTKAKNIKEASRIIAHRYHGMVPPDREALMDLPGVGTKTASLTLSLGFGIDAICVDTHVHRIVNRLGWIDTDTPEKSEKALEQVLPQNYWIPVNELLIHFGQQICRPQSPFCSRCPLSAECPRIGVGRTR